MGLTPGTRLGVYEVIASLGAGGMGEVYRARDTRLKREVALKILPEGVASDPDRLARFEREAELLASLNHPHIANIYGVEESPATDSSQAGVRALVMELVPGDSLADRIARGRLAMDEALALARQIADALEAAHERGIIHRDLKPANIMVTPESQVKVLDFGLAKAVEGSGGAGRAGGAGREDLTNSPTLMSPALVTGANVILGTAAYMAPEQAKGRPIDKRADIWAFGCVLFEMLSGRRPFVGETISETLAAVMKDQPPWQALPPGVPLSVQRLLHRCLEKDPRDRLRDIGDARIELHDVSGASAASAAQTVPNRTTVRARALRIAFGTALLLVGIAAGVLLSPRSTPSPPPQTSRLNVSPPRDAAIISSGNTRDIAISPDGRRIAYVGGNGTSIFVRDLDRTEAIRIDDMGLPSQLFFSPDGKWIGFVDGIEALRRVPSSGGRAEFICRVTQPGVDASAGADGTIVFSQYGSLWRVPGTGGKPQLLAEPDRQRGEVGFSNPMFLPGFRAVLFVTTPSPAADGRIAVLDLQTGTRKVVLENGSRPRYVSSGHLVYRSGRALRVVPFDLDRLEVIGEPTPLPEPILITAFGNYPQFDVADNGTLLYTPAEAPVAARTVVWVDRSGREQLTNLPVRSYTYPAIAPEGAQAAFDIRDQENDIWVWDIPRNTLRRLTFGPGFQQQPLWSRRGQILYVLGRAVMTQRADGSGSPETLVARNGLTLLNSMSPDGTRVVFREDLPETGHDLLMLTLSDKSVQPLLQTPANELNAEISPDGRWMAYESDESGRFEIYVRPFPNVNDGRWQVSNGGGRKALWNHSGRELFFVSAGSALMAVPIESGATFSAGAPVRLFAGNYFFGGASSLGRTYDVSHDGQRFLMIKQDDSRPISLAMVLNWTEELKRLVPRK